MSEQLLERLWFQPAKEGEDITLRKWASKPFDNGTEYVRADVVQSQLAEARGEIERLRRQLCRYDAFTFVVTANDYPAMGANFMATLGDYDLDCLTGEGETPAEAIIEWLDLHGGTLPETLSETPNAE